MPTKFSDSLQYLINAVSGAIKINSPVLKDGYFPSDNTHTALHTKGKDAVVFQLQLQKQLKAVKIWPAPANPYLRIRYGIIEKHLNNTALHYFTKIAYLKEAITLKDTPYDVLLMDWAGRQNIKEYISSNLGQKEKINALAEKILRLHLDLNQAGISHGHLHTGNIYAGADNELKLVDYDSMCIKDFAEEKTPVEQKYPDYCHPANSKHATINRQADYFVALILYLGTKAIAADAVLWGRYKVAFQENFLFTAADFLDLTNTSIYKYLKKIQSPEIDKLLDILVMYCEEKDPDQLKPFYTYLEKDVSLANRSAFTEPKNSQDKKNGIMAIPAGEIKSLNHITPPAAMKPEENNTAETAFITPAFEQNDKYTDYSETAKDILPVTERKFASKKAVYNIPAKKQQKKFIIAGACVGLVILTASYFLGSLADNLNANTFNVQPAPQTKSQPAEVVKKQKADAVQKIEPAPKQEVYIKHDTVAAEIVETNDLPVAANHTTAQEIAKEEEPAKKEIAKVVVSEPPVIHPPVVHPPFVKTAAVIPDKKPAENTILISKEKEIRNTAYKPVIKKINNTKKQPSGSFAIGAPPKR